MKQATRCPKLSSVWKKIRSLIAAGVIVSAWSVTDGGIAEGLFKMSLGNRLGFAADPGIGPDALFDAPVGAIIAERE